MMEISIIRDLIACFGVIAGFSYYVLTVRATRKNQQMQLEARKAQLYNQIYSWFTKTETLVEYMEMLNWEWTDYGDFERKFMAQIIMSSIMLKELEYGLLLIL